MNRRESQKNIQGVFNFMAQAYEGDWQFRWGNTPYFQSVKNGRQESITSHVWGCMGLWMQLRRVCPELNQFVDHTKVYEILWGHDLGETYKGDISAVLQLQGEGVDKHLLEREEIKRMASSLPNRSRKDLLERFDKFESPPEKIDGPETLIAIFLDSLQGNHFCLTFGNDLPKHSATISKIINKFQVPYFRRLVEVLIDSGQPGAAKEIKQILTIHLDQIKQAKIDIDTTNLGNLILAP